MRVTPAVAVVVRVWMRQRVREQLAARLHGQRAVSGPETNNPPVLLETAARMAEREIGRVVAGHLRWRHGWRSAVLARALAQSAHAHVTYGLRRCRRLGGRCRADGGRLQARRHNGALAGASFGARGAALSVGSGLPVGHGRGVHAVAQVVERVVVDRPTHVFYRLFGVGWCDDFELTG